MSTAAIDPKIMQCMEVWGGNQAVDSGVMMAGLDAWVFSRPYQDAEAGGDLHYVSSCATGRITRLMLADVSGHGAGVAAVTRSLRSLLRRYVNYIDPGSFVRALNKEFAKLAEAGCFATALVCTVFGPTNELTLCNAGHPAPLLYRARRRQWMWLDQTHVNDAEDDDDSITNVPLGLIAGTRYPHMTVKLEVGDLCLCVTDSLLEARDRDGQLLGMAGLLREVEQLDLREPARLIEQLLARIAALGPGNLEHDDLTALLFRPNGLGAKVPWQKRWAAPLRLLAAIGAGLLPGGQRIPWPELSWRNLRGN